jgi:hypothetical protein
MDPTTIGALIVSVITAVGVLIERSLKHMKRMKSRCFCAELDINTKSTTSSDRTSVDLSPSGPKEPNSNVQFSDVNLIVDAAFKRLSEVQERLPPTQNLPQ